MEPSPNCKICGLEMKNDSHLKSHKISQENYYKKYYPKTDLYSLEPIHFKSKDQYLSNDFNSKVNLKLWLKSQDSIIAQDYCKALLKKRIFKKNLLYSPAQIELKSILSPPIEYFNKLFGNYYELCGTLGLKNKFRLPEPLEFTDYSAKTGLIVDTREQEPLKIKNFNLIHKKLEYGDYALEDSTLSQKVNIERKSLADFIGTLSNGYERFQKELDRCKEDGGYLVILVEDLMKNALSFNYLPHISRKIRVSPEFVFNNARSLSQKYDNIQFLFVDGRKEAAEIAVKLLCSNGSCTKYDLQLCYDTGMI